MILCKTLYLCSYVKEQKNSERDKMRKRKKKIYMLFYLYFHS